MRAGQLRHRIVVEQSTPARDDIGQEVDSWATYATRQAEDMPQSGREFVVAKQVNATLTHLFRIRYDVTAAAITTDMRINYDSRLFDIIAPPLDQGGRHRELQIMALEKV